MMGSFLTRGLVMVLGYTYPAYECFKIAEKSKPEIGQLRFWCQYCISASNGHRWTTLSGLNDVGVRVTVHKPTDPGQPNGVVLSAATSYGFQFLPRLSLTSLKMSEPDLSGMFFPMGIRSKRSPTLQMAHIQGTVYLFFVYAWSIQKGSWQNSSSPSIGSERE